MINNYKHKQSRHYSIARLCMLLLLLGATSILYAQVSVTATSGTTGPTSYTTVNAAFAAITAGTHQGDIQITITANTTEPTFAAANQLVASGTGSANYSSVTIKPQGDVVVNSAAAPTASRGMLEFIGADNITIDGDDPLTPGVRNLTFQMATSANVTAVLRFSSSTATSNGCLNTVVKNCNIIGSRNSTTTNINSFGIFSGLASATATVTTASGAADNDNMLLENNNIQRCYFGIYTYGISGYVHDNLVIRNNVIGTNVLANMVGFRGILTAFTQATPSANSLIIEGNDIMIGDTITGWSANVSAIDLATTNAGAIIRNNHIHDVCQPSTVGYGAYGIFFSSGTANNSVRIHNNIIRNIRTYTYQSSLTSTWQPIGIFAGFSGITDLRINHNTILMPQQLVANSTYSSHGVLLVSGVVLSQFNNNSIHNQYASSAGYAFTSNAIANISTASMDRNNYFVQGTNIGYVNGGARTTLAAWKLASAKDTNSVSVIPPYISATNLRLQAGAKSALESNGAVTSITTDIDGNVRPGPVGSIYGGGTAPDIGAHEADMLPDLLAPDSVNATQVVQTIAPGDTSKAIMNIKVYVSGSIGTPFNLSAIHLNTQGTTVPADITNAKVFYTGSSSVFSTNELYGTVTSPNGGFTITGTKAVGAGVHNLWVAYDISASAVSGNSADVRLDSVSIGSVHLKPLNGNPAGVVSISNPMTYVSSTTIQPIVSKVGQGTSNNMVIGVQVVTSATGAPISLTELNINLNGTTDTADIQNIKVWYTGTSNTFAANNQFGATVAFAPATFAPFALTVTGNQLLVNDTNYFWVTYDIKTAATLTNVVDAECTGVTVAGTPHVTTVTAPAGNREIRASHCNPIYVTGKTYGDLISRVRIIGTSLDNNSGTAPVNPAYTFFSATSNTTTQLVQGSSYTMEATIGSFASQGVAAWIDYNDDGIFQTTERIGFTNGTISTSFGTGSFPITLSCASIPGTFRMRVRCVYAASGNTIDPCLSYGFGETEDYDVTILPNPTVFSGTVATQRTGSTFQGAQNMPLLRMPIKVTGCQVATLNNMYFRYSGTNAADVSAVTIYRTVDSVFSTTNAVATINNPTTNMVFTMTENLVVNDTTWYWLAFDVSSTATIGNTVDAIYDSIDVLNGVIGIPGISNPAGNYQIALPMSHLGSLVTHPTTGRVYQNDVDAQVLRLRVIMSSTGAPVNLSSIDINLNGTTDTADISNIKVWYTGASDNFATTTQFGTTVFNAPAIPSPFGFTVTGNQMLLNDTNYFWVTYDVKGTATVLNVIDGEITQVTIGGTFQTPSVTAPTGNREIRTPYCIPTHSGGSLVTNLVFNNISHSPSTSVAPWYRLFPQSGNTTTTLLRGVSYNLTISYDAASIGSVWIDFNDDGVFSASEWVQLGTNSTGGTFTINVPCNATLGDLRMRIRSRSTGSVNGATDACTLFGSGECQDYTVTILDNPLAFGYVGAQQQTGIVAPGTLDKSILRIPVRANGCGTAVLTEVHMNTAGTTNVTDIVSAKLYRTTGTTFNTTDLRQTVFAPNGQFVFAITDTLPYTNDTVNYWLAYDINSGASFGNFVDARLDSIQILGNYQLPANGNPSGNVQINAPMTFVSATTTQDITTKVEQGSTNNQIIGVQVSMSASGSAVSLTELNINLNGTTDTADIQNIKVWYTGTSNTFATTNQFGTTVANAPATFAPFALAITGSQSLLNGTNYFWVTYDIKSAATVTNLVDAECTGITVAGAPQVPSVTAPSGNREIRVPACTPTYTNACSSDDFINNVSTTGGTTNISNLNSGCNGNPNNFIYYPNQVVTVAQGATFTINYQSGASWGQGFKIYIDYNNDGDFIDDGELVANAASSTLLNTSNITVPLNASIGTLRLRVRCAFGAEPATACGNENYGETEDYNINVLPAPPPTAYVWNQTTPGSYVTPGNWTPARVTTNLNDILVFNGGGNVTVNNTITQTVSKLVVSNNTVVTLNGTADLTVADTLDLVSGRLNSGTGVNPILGSSITKTGYLQGTGKVEGKLTRWFSASTGTYVFPLSKGTDSRSASITYTTAPTTAGKLEVRYVTGAPGKNGLPIVDGALTLDSISKDGIWRATASSGLAGGVFDIVVNADNIPGANNFATTALVARADNSSPWFAVGTQVATTGSNAAMVLSRTGLNGFGEVGIAGDIFNPLPVKLINLVANVDGKDVLVSWITASEVNNRGFNVERSIDGKTFEYVGFVKGMGNSSVTNNYSLEDVNAFVTTGVNKLYYRLKQLDNDGKFEYSKVVTVENNERKAETVITYPNPFSDKVTVELQNVNAGTVKVEVLDISGRLVTTVEEVVNQGIQTITVNGLSGLTQGVYMVRVTASGVTQTSKLIKQ